LFEVVFEPIYLGCPAAIQALNLSTVHDVSPILPAGCPLDPPLAIIAVRIDLSDVNLA